MVQSQKVGRRQNVHFTQIDSFSEYLFRETSLTSQCAFTSISDTTNVKYGRNFSEIFLIILRVHVGKQSIFCEKSISPERHCEIDVSHKVDILRSGHSATESIQWRHFTTTTTIINKHIFITYPEDVLLSSAKQLCSIIWLVICW